MTAPTPTPLAEYEQALRDTITGWRNAVTTIRIAVDADRRIASTAAGEVTAERVAAIRPRWVEVLDAIVARADTTVAQLVQRSMNLLPQRDDSLEAMMDRQARWARWTYFLGKHPNLRPKVVIEGAETAADVFTLADELPMYYKANGFNDEVTDIIVNLAVSRLAEITGPAAVAALTAADAAEIARTRMQPVVDQARNEISGTAASSSTLHAAVTGWADSTAQSRRYAGLPLT